MGTVHLLYWLFITSASTHNVKQFNSVLKNQICSSAIQIGDDAYLLKNYFATAQQIELFEYTINLSQTGPNYKEFEKISVLKPYPITWYNLVYTSTSISQKPYKWLNEARDIWFAVTGQISDAFNSVYCILYTPQSKMRIHNDKYCDWGISVSLGASIDFYFNDDVIKLDSGDVLVADFSIYPHGVIKVYDNHPNWLNQIHSQHFDFMKLNRTRCSIQIRAVELPKDPIMTTNQFKNMLLGYKHFAE
eukprot:551828_1